MKTAVWTTEFEVMDKFEKIEKNLPFVAKDVFEVFNKCYVCSKNRKILMFLEISDNDTLELKDKFLITNLCEVSAGYIADIIALKFNTSVELKKVYPGKIKYKPLLIEVPEKPTFLDEMPFHGTITQILEAYREIKNEKNASLRFLMYYRLLECLSVKHKNKVDELIREHKIATLFIKEKRNPKSTKSLITHLRNKIHPTKLTYKFPYNTLGNKANLSLIERVVREVIFKIIEEKKKFGLIYKNK